MKLLIATPLKAGMSGKFLNGLVPLLRTTPHDFITVEGPCVNFARNDAAQIAVDQGYDGLLQIDEDIRWTIDHVTRILSHSVDIVAGCYRARGGGDWLHRVAPEVDLQLTTSDLVPCIRVPTGFLYTSVKALRVIWDANPDRWYRIRENSDLALSSTHMEWFPMGVIGDCSATAKLDRIRGILSLIPRMENKGYIPSTALEKIREVVEAKGEPGRLIGEDYYFCDLALRAGFTVYADTKLQLEHAT